MKAWKMTRRHIEPYAREQNPHQPLRGPVIAREPEEPVFKTPKPFEDTGVTIAVRAPAPDKVRWSPAFLGRRDLGNAAVRSSARFMNGRHYRMSPTMRFRSV